MKSRLSKPLKSVLKIVLSFAALLFVFNKIDGNEVMNIYRRSLPIFLILALLMFSFSKLIAAFRLNRFFNAIEIVLQEKYNLKLYLLGMFYNLFLPGGIGGDGYKIYLLNKKFNVKAGKIFWAVFHDRLSGVLALFCLAVIFSLFLPIEIIPGYKNWAWIGIPAAVSGLFLIMKFFYPYFSTIYLKTSSLSFLVQGIQTISALFIFWAIGGTESTSAYLFIFLVSSIVAMLPITIGGIGSREITFLYGSKLLGLDENLSIAMSLMFYLITAFVSFWGILYSLRNSWQDDRILVEKQDHPQG